MARLTLALCVHAALGLSACTPGPTAQVAHGIASPDGRIRISAGIGANASFDYQVTHDGHPLIAQSPAGLVPASGPMQPLEIVSAKRTDGVTFNGMVIDAVETAGQHRKVSLELRAYDSGAAFQLIWQGPAATTARIARETTRFDFSANALCLAVHQNALSNSHEGRYEPAAADQLHPDGYYDLPLVCQTQRAGETFALSESGLSDFTTAYLVARPKHALGVAVKLTSRPDDPSVAVVAPIPVGGLKTPWRVVMIADRPEQLIASTLIDDLAAPSVIGNADWVVPGTAAWGWWSGLLAPSLADPGHNEATYERYIDFASRSGLRYYLIDRGWAWRGGGDSDDPIADVTRTTGGVDLPKLADYARRRHVGLWLWVNWKALDRRMDAALALYQRLGIAGIKVDYLNRQDQQMVAFYERLLAAAARHHLMVDIHAAFVPRGLNRTYPNFITQEGVMGAEYNRWSDRVTASYNVELAYSRAIIGPMDYAPGAFRNVSPSAFDPRSDAPEVMTTRAQQLAMTVVYPSPMLVLADSPSTYLRPNGTPVPGAEFLFNVPTAWNQTVGLAGAFGRWIAVARRKGAVWYVGVMNDEQARTVAIPLDFLGGGRWRVASWIDGATPAAVVRKAGTLDTDHRRLIVPLAASGGAALRFTKSG